MEALFAWLEERKKYIPLLAIILILSIFFLPHEFKGVGIAIGGLLWHFSNAETASAYWLWLGFSPGRSEAFAIAGGMVLAGGTCTILFPLKKFRLPGAHGWLASHPWVAKLPYPSIVILGLFLPTGGVALGVFIAKSAELRKAPAILTILGVNLIKLAGWNQGIALLSRHIH